MSRKVTDQLAGPILVVGCGGFVGAALLRALLKHRRDVKGLARQMTWRLRDVPSEHLLWHDLNERGAIEKSLRELQPRSIFYCVAYGSRECEKNEDLIHDTQVRLLRDFKTLVTRNCPELKAFIHAGSSSEYGSNSAGPREDAALNPNSDYACAKVAAVYLLQHWGRHENFPCLNLRLYSVYGPGEDLHRLVPQLLWRSLNQQWPPLAHPEISRDFVHIDDVVAAFVRTAVALAPEHWGSSLNIGSGRKTRLQDLAALVGAQGWNSTLPTFGQHPGRFWDRRDWYACVDRAREVFSWRAQITLADGLASFRQWLLNERESGQLTDAHFSASPAPAPLLSLIVACYRDAESLSEIYEECVQSFRGVPFEIVFVNDASPDDSTAVIRRLSERDARVRGVLHSRNFGSQAAFVSGLERARGSVFVLMDGDLQDPPSVARQMYDRFREGHSVVLGRRVDRCESAPMKWARKIFYLLLQKSAAFPVDRDVGEFSLFDDRVRRLILKSHRPASILRLIRSYAGFPAVAVDYVRPERRHGRSTNSLRKNGAWALRAFFMAGAFPWIWGFALSLLALVLWRLSSRTLPSLVSLLLALIFFVTVLALYVSQLWPRWAGFPASVVEEEIFRGRLSSSPTSEWEAEAP